MPTDWPATASLGSSGTFQASIDLTLAVLLEGENTSSSPTCEPALDPAGDDPALVELVDVLDRQAQRQVDRRRPGCELVERLEHGRPWYQGIAGLRAAMLSPSRAEIGMKPVGVTPSPAR